MGEFSARIASARLTYHGQNPLPVFRAMIVLLRCKTMPAAQRKGGIDTRERGDPRFERADTAAADRYQIVIDAGHLDQFVVAGALVADDPLDVDDVAAVNTDKTAVVEPRFDVADRERAKQFVVAVENVGVMRVGVDRDHILHGEKMRAAVTLDRQMPGKSPG